MIHELQLISVNVRYTGSVSVIELMFSIDGNASNPICMCVGDSIALDFDPAAEGKFHPVFNTSREPTELDLISGQEVMSPFMKFIKKMRIQQKVSSTTYLNASDLIRDFWK